MEYLIQLLSIVLPAGLVIYGMFIITVSFLKKEKEMKWVDIKTKNTELLLPLRLQAAERLCLLMERISPNNLIRRINEPGFTAGELHSRLVEEIRNEFNHNLSQQVYFSDETWESVRTAVEQTLSLINRSYQQVDGNEKSLDLAKTIFQLSLEQEKDIVVLALKRIKDEVRIYY
ncbi:hypothetical protein SAMN05192553_103642 [Cyclobacterium xiamenense]|uniref:Uncharacterized protein n=1 Tax=Cyclobacterium xiamenense TaxID=1297121 RepID=A0A1H6YPM0_9BACT|nr:hypothetical protein [Cyclobacterium xiamenense]SEJ39240.1 hypothetical protein SAMN05192553_103642 [Cyclobacterium xiamenense]